MMESEGIIKILFILDCLEGGGAQRAVLNIINGLDREKFLPELALFSKRGEFLGQLAKDVKVHDLDCKAAKYAPLKLAGVIRKSSCGLVFSTLTYVNEVTYLACKMINRLPPVVMRGTSFESENLKGESPMVGYLIKRAYRSADSVVALTRAMKIDFADNFSVPENKISVIPNMVDIAEIDKLAKEPVSDKVFRRKDRPLIMAMGRLGPEKGFDRLIRAFALVRKEMECGLVILGEGKLRNDLIKLAGESGLQKDVHFPGFKVNPYRYLARSDLYVMSSLWEGFPNSLLEAMACGMPVLVADSPSGPAEIITSGVNGIIAPPGDIRALASGILKILRDSRYSSALKEAGRLRAEEFGIEKVIGSYEKLFKRLVLPEKKTLLHLITGLNPGGTERFLQEIVLGTRDRYNHVVAYMKKCGIIGDELKRAGVEVVKASNLFRIYGLIRKRRPAMLATYLYRANILGRAAGRIYGLPVVSSQRGIDSWKSWYHVLLDGLTSGWAEKIIANSKSTRQVMETREQVTADRLEVVYTGIKQDWFLRKPSAAGNCTVGFVGRLHREKGADMLPGFAEKLRKNMPDIKLRIAGGGKMMNRLKKALPPNCMLEGWLGKQDLMRFYDSVEMIVMLSREESFPRVLLEAGARGVPAVAPDVGGVSEFIEDGRNGFIYPEGDIEAAVRKTVSYVKGKPAFKSRVAENVLTRARSYGFDRMADRISEIYDSVIRG